MGEELNIFPSKLDATTQTQLVEMTLKSPEELLTPPPSLIQTDGEEEDPLAGLEPISDTDLEEGEVVTPNSARPAPYRRLAFSDRPACTPRIELPEDDEDDQDSVLQNIFNRRRRRNRRKARKTAMEFKDDYVSLKNIGKASWIEGSWTFTF